MEYEKFLEQNKDEMIFALQQAVRVNSEEGESFMGEKGRIYPFGQGVQQSLELVLKMGRDLGFEAKNVDNYGGHIDFLGTGDKIMGILGHLDVVPAGNDWSHNPYGGEIIDGKLYGRGTTDDKGPVISCLYAMKALKDAGYVPNATIRLILGLDEETNWKGIEHYFSKEKRPDYGFTPDGEFPLINGEKGLLVFNLAKKFANTTVEGLSLRSLKGGIAPNSVADSARAVVNSPKSEQYEEIKEKIAAYRSLTGHKINCKGVGKSLEITTTGVAAHGAKPEKGLNAISVMMDFLGGLNFVNEDLNDFIGFYNKHIGFCTNGDSLGIGLKDEPSGELTLNVGMVEFTKGAGKLVINVRYPVTFSDKDVYEPLDPILTRYNIGLIKEMHKVPVYIDRNNPMVKTLLDIYRKHTGDTESEPLVIGGGTYAKATPGILAFGALFPGDEDLMHQKDECIDLDRFMQMTKIYAEAIYKLSSEEYND
ncbi:MAG: dipeptidase PepV [Firmicutes bacterium]|nr:dipeptidase PepV [Bacillota bacterium]